jgi:hypothetical protein
VPHSIYEEEVRFIFGSDYDVLQVNKELMLEIDPLPMISDVVTSPHLRQAEQDAVSQLIERLRSTSPLERLGLSAEWVSTYGRVTPFTGKDKPPAAFRDLDRFAGYVEPKLV